MQPMTHKARLDYVQALKARSAESAAIIQGAEVHDAKRVLLKFQYASRIIYAVDESSRRHFDDRFKWEKCEEWKEIGSWRFMPPSEFDFVRVMLSWSTTVDFYTQVNEFCSEIFGLPIPADAEGFDEYARRAGIDEASWCWRYDNAAKAEETRWFTSGRKLAEIEQHRIGHRARAERCSIYLAKIHPLIRPASDLLKGLKRSELEISPRLQAAERANEALLQNVQLKHLLLEEGSNLSGAYSEITRGL